MSDALTKSLDLQTIQESNRNRKWGSKFDSKWDGKFLDLLIALIVQLFVVIMGSNKDCKGTSLHSHGIPQVFPLWHVHVWNFSTLAHPR